MEKEEEIKEDKSISAKSVSLIGQILAAIWVAGWCSYQFIMNIAKGVHVEITDIIYSGFAIAGCFSPVFVSIIMDKIKNIRFGDRNGDR